MVVEFISLVDTLQADERGCALTFVDRSGRYIVPWRPADLIPTARAAFMSGRRVRVTYESKSYEVADIRPA